MTFAHSIVLGDVGTSVGVGVEIKKKEEKNFTHIISSYYVATFSTVFLIYILIFYTSSFADGTAFSSTTSFSLLFWFS